MANRTANVISDEISDEIVDDRADGLARGIAKRAGPGTEHAAKPALHRSLDSTLDPASEQERASRPPGLASARDRARLRARQAEERARVERVLARGPRETDRPRGMRRGDRPTEPRAEQGSVPRRARRAGAKVDCAVCGGGEILEDEVFEGGAFRLSRCRRCDHRWTERLSVRFVPRVRRPGFQTQVDRSESRSASGA